MSELEQLPIETLPSEWEVRPFGEFCDFMGGTQPPKSTFVYQPTVGYVRLLQIRDFEDDSKATYIPDKGRVRRIGADDISIARYGASVGRILTGKEGAINVAIMTTFPNTSVVDKGFLFFVLQHPNFYRYLTGLGGRAAQAGFNKGEVSRFRFPLPPLPEQKKIAHILSTVQRAIEAQERIIQTTTELKKALMHKLFTEGLRNEPQKQTEIGPVPESWEVVPFDQFATLQRGYDLRKQDFRHGKLPVIGATQTIGYHDTANVKAPGVTVVRSGSSAGKPLFISEDFWAHNVVLFVKDFHGNIPKFVYYKILALDLTQYRQGVAVPTLNRNTFSAIEVALPRLEEQQEIVDALDSVGTKTEAAERKKAQLQDLFRTLLHELMTAKTRVPDLGFNLVENQNSLNQR
jgi:type I restriction enzyme S subunit